jgi:hypothetical protein
MDGSRPAACILVSLGGEFLVSRVSEAGFFIRRADRDRHKRLARRLEAELGAEYRTRASTMIMHSTRRRAVATS